MSDFKFLKQPSGKSVISAPRRAARPDIAKDSNISCPFCPGREKDEEEVFRVGGIYPDSNWKVRVIPNKFPFAPIHEIVIHSQDHHKNFGELDSEETELIFKTYRQRFQTHQDKGQVYIFHNRGEGGGGSLPHPHSQIAVVPNDVKLEIQPPQEPDQNTAEIVQTTNFNIFCPLTSDWPDEVWIASKEDKKFGDVTDEEIADLSSSITKVIKILDTRHGNEFPYNFYIYPGENWYLRIIPRQKSLGGFEIGTNVFINTQDPKETMAFIKEHFENPDFEKIKSTYQASHKKAV